MKILKALAFVLIAPLSFTAFKTYNILAESGKEGNTKIVHKFTSSSTPEEIVGKLKAGKRYKIREIKAPNGYKKLEKDIDFTVNTDGKLQEIKITNEKDLEPEKQKAKDEVNKSSNLSEEEKKDFNSKIDNATNKDEIGKVVEEAKAKDTENLNAEKQKAKDEVNKDSKNGFVKTGISKNTGIFSILVLLSVALSSMLFYKKIKNKNN